MDGVVRCLMPLDVMCIRDKDGALRIRDEATKWKGAKTQLEDVVYRDELKGGPQVV